jgi:hypothetical protein
LIIPHLLFDLTKGGHSVERLILNVGFTCKSSDLPVIIELKVREIELFNRNLHQKSSIENPTSLKIGYIPKMNLRIAE